MTFSLDGKIALVTGAAGGQGAAEARLFVELGARVLICDILEEKAQALAAELGNAATGVRLDVSDEASWRAVCDQAASQFGRIDILVNNAAILKEILIEEMTVADFQRVLNVNQVGPFLGMRAVVPLMKGAGGSIINISSIGGVRPAQGYAAYGSTKFAVRGLTKVAALEFAPFGIRVNTVLPGYVRTSMTEDLLAREAVQQSVARVPIGRAADPVEIAWMVAFLASDASSYVTGSDFVCDGGQLTGMRK